MVDRRDPQLSLDSREVTSVESTVAVLPSGREFGLHRSRWDGVLDREEYEYCRKRGISLGYDCAQIGWVAQTFTDESIGVSSRPTTTDDAPRVRTMDPEERAIKLRGVVEEETALIVGEVQRGRMPLHAGEQRVALLAAGALKKFEGEFGLSACDLAHWVLECAAADALRDVREPLHQPHAAQESTGFSFREWSPDDAVAYTRLLGNPRVWKYLPEPFPSEFTVETALDLIEVGSIGFHHDTLAIEVDGRPIGQCLLRFDRPFAGSRAAEVAYWLGEDHWGQGWMTRVLPAFTHRSFRQHAIDVIYAWIMKDNEPSIRVAERAGYRRARVPHEERLAESLRRSGFVRYATYRADWTT